MEVNAVTDAVNLGRICQQHPSATGAPLPNNDATPRSAHPWLSEANWGPSQSEQEEADRPRRGVSPRQGVPCSAAVTAVGDAAAQNFVT